MLQRVQLQPKHYRAIGIALASAQLAIIVLGILSFFIPLN